MTTLLLAELLRPGRRLLLTRGARATRSRSRSRGCLVVPEYFKALSAFAEAREAHAQALPSTDGPAVAQAKDSPALGRRQVALIGGIGRMQPQYRALVESHGYELLYREQRNLPRPPLATLAAVLVVTSIVSHPLRENAARLAEVCRVPIVYLRAPSLAAVRDGLRAVLGGAP